MTDKQGPTNDETGRENVVDLTERFGDRPQSTDAPSDDTEDGAGTVLAFDREAEEQRNVLAFLQRKCDEYGWDLDDVLEDGFPVDSYQCQRCAVPPLMSISPGVIETDDGAIHANCGTRMVTV